MTLGGDAVAGAAVGDAATGAAPPHATAIDATIARARSREPPNAFIRTSLIALSVQNGGAATAKDLLRHTPEV
jgi:hypothetical protein